MKNISMALLFLTGVILSGCAGARTDSVAPSDTTTIVATATPEPAITAADWVLSEGRWETYTEDDGLPRGAIDSLALDSDGHVWLANNYGAGWFADGTYHGVFSGQAFKMAIDAQGCVWITDQNGISTYEQGVHSVHTRGDELSRGQPFDIMVDAQDRIWVTQGAGGRDGTLGGGVELLEGGEWRHPEDSEMAIGTFWKLVEDTSGNIWATATLGVARFDGTAWESLTVPDIPHLGASAAALDPSGRVWIGTRRDGILIWNGEGWTQITVDDGLAEGKIWEIAFDGAGRAWVATTNGLSVLDSETWTTYTAEDGLVHNDVRSLAIEDNGVWAGTWSGLSHLVFGGVSAAQTPRATPAPTAISADPSPTPRPPMATPAPTAMPADPSPTPSPPTATPALVGVPAGSGLGDTWIRPADGMVMVYLTGGTFPMGSDESDEYADDDEFPQHPVTLNPFWIDRTEVTNAQYAQCVAADACTPPAFDYSFTRDEYYGDSSYNDYPVVFVNLDRAATYCAWAGARLLTEAEWEYAARGPEGRIFPWGDDGDAARLNSSDAGHGDTIAVGSYPEGASWCGALDMAGNVWEWVADVYADYSSEQQENPTGPSSGPMRVFRGGSYYEAPEISRTADRDVGFPGTSYSNLGFRCVVPVSDSGS